MAVRGARYELIPDANSDSNLYLSAHARNPAAFHSVLNQTYGAMKASRLQRLDGPAYTPGILYQPKRAIGELRKPHGWQNCRLDTCRRLSDHELCPVAAESLSDHLAAYFQVQSPALSCLP